MSTYLLDTSAWLAHVFNEPGADEVTALFEDSEATIVISALSILETLAQVREECAAWNARATEMEAERDAERGRAASVCREIGADERFDGNWRNGALACADAIERGEPCPPFGGQAWAGKP